MSKYRTLFICLICSLTAGIAGFYFGFREGSQIGLIVEFPFRAQLSMYDLKLLEKGNLNALKLDLESNIDTAMMFSPQLDNSPLLPIMEPVWGLPITENRKSMNTLANYRDKHPSPYTVEYLSKEPFPNTPDGTKNRDWLLEGARDKEVIMKSVITKYKTTSR